MNEETEFYLQKCSWEVLLLEVQLQSAFWKPEAICVGFAATMEFFPHQPQVFG